MSRRSQRGSSGTASIVQSIEISAASSSTRRSLAEGGDEEKKVGAIPEFVPKGPFKLNSDRDTVVIDSDAGTVFTPTEKQMNDFQCLDETTQKLLLKTAVRVFIMKGGRNEPISRATHICAALSQIDPIHKKHAAAVTCFAQEVLKERFGMGLVSEADVVTADAPQNDPKLFVFNILKSPRLAQTLAQNDGDAAFKGFIFLLFHIIWAAPGRKSSPDNLLKEIRQIDDRFPPFFEKGRGTQVGEHAIPELGGTFTFLLNRAKNEGYITQYKETDIQPGEEPKVAYGLGSRFFIEIGKEALVDSYFAITKQEPDEAIYKEIKDEDREIERARDMEKNRKREKKQIMKNVKENNKKKATEYEDEEKLPDDNDDERDDNKDEEMPLPKPKKKRR